jgi:hypothetical protein
VTTLFYLKQLIAALQRFTLSVENLFLADEKALTEIFPEITQLN